MKTEYGTKGVWIWKRETLGEKHKEDKGIFNLIGKVHFSSNVKTA